MRLLLLLRLLLMVFLWLLRSGAGMAQWRWVDGDRAPNWPNMEYPGFASNFMLTAVEIAG